MEKINNKTIQIQSKGAGRLSRDLVPETEYFRYAVDKRNKKVTLLPVHSKVGGNGNCVKIYSANERSKVRMFNMAKILRQLGIAWEDKLHKTYTVKRRGDALEIKL